MTVAAAIIAVIIVAALGLLATTGQPVIPIALLVCGAWACLYLLATNHRNPTTP